MYFDSGTHALSWLVNDSDALLSPGTTTKSIMEMLRGVMPSGNFEYVTDEKHHARFDIMKLWGMMNRHDADLLMIHTIDGIEAAVSHLKKSKHWRDWREKNKNLLDKGSVTYSGQLFIVLDKWEDVLRENDYISPIF